MRTNRDRAAASYGEYAFLKDRVSSDIIERLADTPRMFERALELGAHDGRLSTRLIESGKVDEIVTTDLSSGMVAASGARGLDAIVADEERLPFGDARFDLVVSLLSLHWVNDLPGTLIQIRKTLRPDGLFLAALPGAGTLSELRASLIQAETDITGGASPRVSPLPGLADMAGLLQRAGFALPVADRDTLTVRYDNLFALLKDVKGMGERAAFQSGTQPLSRRVLMRAAEIYTEQFSDEDGRIRASVELVWLSGWAPAPHQPRPKRPGSATASLAAAIGAVEKSAGEKAGE